MVFKTWCSWVHAQARSSIATGGRDIGFKIIPISDEVFPALAKQPTQKDIRVAAAIMTGDRSGIKQEHVSALRRSNLAHLLAIFGLHKKLLVGVIFTA